MADDGGASSTPQRYKESGDSVLKMGQCGN